MSSIPPGWYKDPAEPTTQRYWDGGGWIGAPLPADATPPDGPPPRQAPPDSPQAPADNPPAPQTSPATRAAPPVNGIGTPPAGGWTPYPYPPPGTHPRSGQPAHPEQPGPTQPGWPPYHMPPPQPRPHGMALAPFGARLVARLIDITAVLLLNIAINGWFVWQFLMESWPTFAEIFRRSLANDRSTDGIPQLTERAANLQLTIILLAAAIWWAYEVPATANTGQTLGKRLTRLKVVTVEPDGRFGFARSFRRWNTLGLPTLLWFCCVGFVLQLIDCVFLLFDRPLRQALHDKSAQTVVVQLPTRPASAAGTGGGAPGSHDTPASSA
ncbi:RDD family protein [Solwaraspora sp. WMMB335]|uniref:RDD family protein n=1 Tax=Solwaraspora sp. WMMB335 TaxID=3404118 RepID=UPI003B949DD0